MIIWVKETQLPKVSVMQRVEFPWIEEQNLCHLRTVSSLAVHPPSTRKSSPKYLTTTFFDRTLTMTTDRIVNTVFFMIGTLTVADNELPTHSSVAH